MLRVFLRGVSVLTVLSLVIGHHFLLLDGGLSIAFGIHLLGFALGAQDGLGELMISGDIDVSCSFTVGARSGLVIGGEIAFVSSLVSFWLRRVGTQQFGFGGAGLLWSRSFGGFAAGFGRRRFGGFGSRGFGSFGRLTIYQ